MAPKQASSSKIPPSDPPLVSQSHSAYENQLTAEGQVKRANAVRTFRKEYMEILNNLANIKDRTTMRRIEIQENAKRMDLPQKFAIDQWHTDYQYEFAKAYNADPGTEKKFSDVKNLQPPATKDSPER